MQFMPRFGRTSWLIGGCKCYYAPLMSDEAAQPKPADPRPVIGITMGDPGGIGAEVIVKALADEQLRSQARFVIYGMNELMSYTADLAEIDPYWWRVQHDSPHARSSIHKHHVVVLDYDDYSILGMDVHRPTKQGGAASLAFLDDAVAAAMLPAHKPNRIDAIVTAPVCKESWQMAGCRFPGHTEFLQHRTKSKRSVMMFYSSQMMVTLATVHVALMDIRNVFTVGKVFDAIDLGHEACVKLGIKSPKLGICGLNPHASENGQFGDEESRIITPAIELARANGMNVVGPLPGDTIFIDAKKRRFDMVVAMYHDQGLIPLKLLAFDEAVNVTLGLPIIRTSVDHGTAFDIVGQNKADEGSMKSAIQLAINMVRPNGDDGQTPQQAADGDDK